MLKKIIKRKLFLFLFAKKTPSPLPKKNQKKNDFIALLNNITTSPENFTVTMRQHATVDNINCIRKIQQLQQQQQMKKK